MPKKSQRKKREQEKDFQKKKLKVGKGKVGPTNKTDTSIHSKLIHVPSQSITIDKSMEITNSRNNTLNDLLIQSKHYSASSRKDAVIGMKEFFSCHPQVFQIQMGTILETMSRLMVDEDMGVRKSLLGFFKEYLPSLNQEDVMPFLPLVVAYLCASMTHIYDDIRMDGLRFLQLWLLQFKEGLSKFGERIIPNFLSMISQYSDTKAGKSNVLFVNPSSKLGTSQSRLEILQTFYGFLKTILNIQCQDWWFLQGHGVDVDSFLSKEKFDEQSEHPVLLSMNMPFKSDFISQKSSNTTLLDKMAHSRDKKINVTTNDLKNEYQLTDLETLQSFMQKLMPVLIDFWVEGAPLAFQAGNPKSNPNLLLLYEVLKLMNLIWSAWASLKIHQDASSIKSQIQKWRVALHKQMEPKFPFDGQVVSGRDHQLSQMLSEMNIYLCHCLMIMESNEPKQETINLVQNHVTLLFQGKKAQKGFHFEQSQEIFSILWRLKSESLFASFCQYASQLPSTSMMKEPVTIFLSLATKLYYHPGYQGPSLSETQTLALKSWILSLVAYVSEAKPAMVMNLLDTLCFCLSRNVCHLKKEEDLVQSFIPIFGEFNPETRTFACAFSQFETEAQCRLIDLLRLLPYWTVDICKSLSFAMNTADLHPKCLSLFLTTLKARATSTDEHYVLPSNLYLSLLYTIYCVGNSESMLSILDNINVNDLDAVLSWKRSLQQFKQALAYPKSKQTFSEQRLLKSSLLIDFLNQMSHSKYFCDFIVDQSQSLLGKPQVPLDTVSGLFIILSHLGQGHVLLQQVSLLKKIVEFCVQSIECEHYCVMEKALNRVFNNDESLKQSMMKYGLTHVKESLVESKPTKHYLKWLTSSIFKTMDTTVFSSLVNEIYTLIQKHPDHHELEALVKLL